MLKGIPSSFPNATSFIPQDLGLNTVDSTTSMLNVLISCWNKTSNTQLKCFKWGWQIEYQMISATNERTKRHSFRYCWWFRNPFPTNRLDGAKTWDFNDFNLNWWLHQTPKCVTWRCLQFVMPHDVALPTLRARRSQRERCGDPVVGITLHFSAMKLGHLERKTSPVGLQSPWLLTTY